MFSSISAFTFTSLALVATTAYAHGRHEHRSPHALPGTWFHARDHPVHALFKRGVGADGQQYPDIGSPEWINKYPAGIAPPDSSQMPQAWAAALKAAEDAGKIPKIPQAIQSKPDTQPVYPAGTNGASPEVCASSVKACQHPDDIWNAPDGTYLTSFDDGPLPFSIKLLDFLKSQKESATHFLIGRTMRENPEPLKATINSGNDIAVHTWSHLFMTSLSNADIVAQLGWCMQIIHDSTGGKVPRFWRPPYGDSDNRVRAIAAEVFGLKTVIWNRDTNDWDGTRTLDAIKTDYVPWVTGPKNPGLVVLHHESSELRVQAFIETFPTVKANGWKTQSLAQGVPGLDGKMGVYWNVRPDGKVTPASILRLGVVAPSNKPTVAPPPPQSTPTSSPPGTTPPPGGSTTPTTDAAGPTSSSGALSGRIGAISAYHLLTVAAVVLLAG